MSDLPRDEGVACYLDEAGKDRVAAYGFLMFLLEAIGSRMDAAEGHWQAQDFWSSQAVRVFGC